MVKLTIDGQALEVPQGSMIIEAADNANITIPRFCYHKKLSVAANCRMCLVDVENSRKPTPACATPVADGMVIFTKSPKAIAYQKAVMEFLLINHPLDCPICDQGGECELQDLSMGYGKDISRYNQGKRVIEDKDIGPLIQTDLTRCIQCTRCVRFGTEIAGLREMGMIGRGEHSEIATFMQSAVSSELSGNVIDLCPVGALTNKPFRYQARAWELQQHPMVSPHDCLGSNLYVHVRRGEVMRAVPRENENLNEVWLSDRDRYSVHALNIPERATSPMIKKKGKWQAVEWLDALEHIAKEVDLIRRVDGADKIASLASPSSTVEEFYLLQKLIRGLGSHNLDFRYHVNDFSYQKDIATTPTAGISLSDLNEAEVILVIGADTRNEVPLIHHRLRQAALNGAKLVFLNPFFFESNITNTSEYCLNFNEMTEVLVHLLKTVVQSKPLSPNFQEEILSLQTQLDTTEWKALADLLIQSRNTVIVTGQLLMAHPHVTEAIGLISGLQAALNAKTINLTPGANASGAFLAGFLPHRGAAAKNLGEEGLNAKAILDPTNGIKAYFLLNVEPAIDSVYGTRANQALEQADLVVAMTPIVTPELKKNANVILPIAALTETAGSYVNVLGEWQSWQGATPPKGEARPAWKVLRVLGNLMSLPGFDYASHEDVLKELRAHLVHMKESPTSLRIPRSLSKTKGTMRLGPLPLYRSDLLVRASTPLQNTPLMQSLGYVGIDANQAKKWNLKEGDALTLTQDGIHLTLPIKIMKVAKDTVFLPRGIDLTLPLGEAYGAIECQC